MFVPTHGGGGCPLGLAIGLACLGRRARLCAYPADDGHSASAQAAGGGVGKAERSVLWEADAALANHPAASGLAETESWATDEKTDRLCERFDHRFQQGRNQVLEGRGSGHLESDDGVWSDEIAGETRQLIRAKWRADCGAESP